MAYLHTYIRKGSKEEKPLNGHEFVAAVQSIEAVTKIRISLGWLDMQHSLKSREREARSTQKRTKNQH